MIKILIDSASDIDQKEAEKMGITLIPMEVTFDDETYLDGVNLSHVEFFEKLIESVKLPKTSQINQYRFEEQFEKLTQNGDQLIVITISSKLSGTYNCARLAAMEYENKVFVVDSLSAAIGERLLCIHALDLIKKESDIQKIIAKLEEKKKRIQVLAVLGTLKYLKKGGRISSVTAFAGEMFNIKPVISIIDGEVKLIGQAIGSKKRNNLLMQHVKKCGGIDFSLPYGVIYSGLSDAVLKKYLQDSELIWKENVQNVANIPIYMIGSTIGTHIGPDAIGVAFYALEGENKK